MFLCTNVSDNVLQSKMSKFKIQATFNWVAWADNIIRHQKRNICSTNKINLILSTVKTKYDFNSIFVFILRQLLLEMCEIRVKAESMRGFGVGGKQRKELNWNVYYIELRSTWNLSDEYKSNIHHNKMLSNYVLTQTSVNNSIASMSVEWKTRILYSPPLSQLERVNLRKLIINALLRSENLFMSCSHDAGKQLLKRNWKYEAIFTFRRNGMRFDRFHELEIITIISVQMVTFCFTTHSNTMALQISSSF